MRDQEITLTTPFPANKIKTKPGRGGSRPMTFISHGLITERLNQAASSWTTERIATHTYTGQDGHLHCAGVEILMCIGEQCHAEAGGPQRQDGFANEIKNAYSDALKRCAMRFGVALEMWEQLIDAMGDEDYDLDHQTGEIQHTPVDLSRTLVDSPINFESTQGMKVANALAGRLTGNGRGNYQPPARESADAAGTPLRATDKQIAFIRSIAKDRGWSDEELQDELMNIYDKPLDELLRRDASAYIETLKSRRPPVELAS